MKQFSKAQQAGDWIHHKGGTQPCEDEQLVEVKLWGGVFTFKAKASEIYWDYNRPKSDWVVQWRFEQ